MSISVSTSSENNSKKPLLGVNIENAVIDNAAVAAITDDFVAADNQANDQ